jgi:2-polyprenyl-3-methyl-5-hydroxy-6-metoxy-1,4-benzoquinol methylase
MFDKDDKRFKSDELRFKYINKFVEGKEILDIGSSEGYLHKLLEKANSNKKFYSLDTENSDFNRDLDKPKKINKKFDTVIAGEVIEHLESPIRFVRYCKSILKKDGRLILTTPNATGMQHLMNPNWCIHYEDYRGHTQTFTIEMIKRICEDEGFKIIYSDYINAFWRNNPLQYISLIIKRLRPDLIIVAEK